MRLRRLTPLFAATALLAPAAPAAAQEPTPLVVVEVATVRAAPDTATVAGEIARTARSAATARRRVERRLASVLRNLDALGVDRADVRTDSVRSFRTRRKGRVRYHAATSLQVRTTDLERLGEILGAFGDASISGPEFEVSDPTAARQQATGIALQRARRRADAAAAALGMRWSRSGRSTSTRSSTTTHRSTPPRAAIRTRAGAAAPAGPASSPALSGSPSRSR